MRTILATFLGLLVLCALAHAGAIRSIVSSIIAAQPSEIQSALESEFSNLASFTATDSSAVSSLSSEINAAAQSFLSDLSSIVSSVSTEINTVTSTVSNAAAVSSGNSIFAVLAGFLMTIVLFHAF